MKKTKSLIFIVLIFIISNRLFSNELINKYQTFWVQFGEEDSILFRFISENQDLNCPNVLFDDKIFESNERVHSYKEDFPIKVCQAVFKNDHKKHIIKFNESEIIINNDIEKVSVFGDTGCVIKKNKFTGINFEQNCNDLNSYPFSLVTEKILSENSDLLIHVGDYFYSEADCKDLKKCSGRPYGDNFKTMKVEFFNDSKKILEKVPFIFIRGNHEDCNRGGKTWSVLLDNSINFKECSTYDNAFKIEFNNIQFYMIDSAYSQDIVTLDDEGKKQIEFYKEEFKKLFSNISSDKKNILLTHRPLFSFELDSWKENAKTTELNLILSNSLMSLEKEKLNKLGFIFSGHVHIGAIIKVFNEKKNLNITQVIAGNGGANLNTLAHYTGQKSIFNEDNKIIDYKQNNNFGFINFFPKENDIKDQIKFVDVVLR